MDGDLGRRWTRKICVDEGVDEWMRTRKREGFGMGVRKQLIRPCTGDVRDNGRTLRSTLHARLARPIMCLDQNPANVLIP